MWRAHRSAVVIAALVIASSTAATCGGGGEGPKSGSRILRATTHAISFTADNAVPGSTLADAAQGLDDAIRQQMAVRQYLDGLANSQDPYGLLLTRALCTGMNQLAARSEQEGGVSDEQWTDFFVEQLGILAPGNPIEVIQQKAESFVTTAQLSQINPRVARVYFQECLRRPR